jgi:3-deoxy-manno-octulosonate cytidylyltransferase (CMP-KDO synthetase)
MRDFTVIIPARLGSQRLPGKVLLDVGGKTMVQRVYEQACKSGAAQVIVATDDQQVAATVNGFGGQVCMTALAHPSGTDRLQEVASIMGLAADSLIVNVQGDEPMIPPAVIDQVAACLANESVDMATLFEVIDDPTEVFDPNVVKVVTSAEGCALYFSRAPIPWSRENFSTSGTIPLKLPTGEVYKRHVGIYGYRVSLLHQFVTWPPAPLELVEKLEQLRVLWQGVQIHIEAACVAIPAGIDTAEDLRRIRLLVSDAPSSDSV